LFFTIIIPTFNSERTITNALDSVFLQTFERYEIIVMDGVSTDATISMIASYNHPKISWYSESDCGIYDAMNKGIAKAKGEWLYFMGSDDRMYGPDVLQQVYDFILKEKADVVYGDVYSTHYGGRYAGAFDTETLTRQNICHQAIFFKSSIFKKTGLFDLRYRIGADYDHNIKWFFNSKIPHAYMDLVIANFADGGYSYTHQDFVFERVKHYKLLCKGLNKLPFRALKRLCKIELEQAKTNKQYMLYVFYTLYFGFIRLRLKLQTIFK